MTKYFRPFNKARHSAGTPFLWLRPYSRNPVDSSLNLCDDAFKIGRRIYRFCRFSFYEARSLSGFRALETRDVLNNWRIL
jgi:hypothetical protein